jgi:hypothetical protein
MAASFLLLTACVLQTDAHLAAFNAQMTGMNEVPPVKTVAGGKLFAVLDRNTLVLRWKLTYSGLSGAVTGGHFHGPATIGSRADAVLALGKALQRPMTEASAVLTPQQATELLAGKWYISIQTAAHPTGEIRGQLILRE